MPLDPELYAALCADLSDEHADLARLIDGADLTAPTPATGWDVADTLAHLAWFDQQAVLAVRDPDAFRAALAAVTDPDEIVAAGERRGRALSPEATAAWWATASLDAAGVLSGLDPGSRHPWYGPDMTAASFVSARLMETWAHGQDVADALGLDRGPTARLRHVAMLGWRAFANSYRVRNLPVPGVELRVELTAPDGSAWTYGPEGSADTVSGSALDFCLVVTQRRHVDDTALVATGAAGDWLRLAQAFAGPPGPGRAPQGG